MKYTQPKIKSTYCAISVIKSEKGTFTDEVINVLMTAGPAYQSEE